MYYAATYPILNHVASSAFGFITCRRFDVSVKRTFYARVHRQSAPVNGDARLWYICMPTHASSPSSACSAKESAQTKEKLQTTFSGEGNSKEKRFIDVWARNEDGSFTFLYFWLRHVHLPAQFIDPQKQTERQSAKLFQSIVPEFIRLSRLSYRWSLVEVAFYLSDDKGGFGDIVRDFRCLSRCFYLLLGKFSSRLAELLLFTLPIFCFSLRKAKNK